ncbi:hypothetical protein ACFQ1A_28850, partial [Massilia pinisoli]
MPTRPCGPCAAVGPAPGGMPGRPPCTNWCPEASTPGTGPRAGCCTKGLPMAGRSTRSGGTGPWTASGAPWRAGAAACIAAAPASAAPDTNAARGNARVTATRCCTGAGGSRPAAGIPRRLCGSGR